MTNTTVSARSLAVTTLAASLAVAAAACAPGSSEERDVETTRSVKAPLSSEGPCEAGLDYAGRCDGDELVWCEDGEQLVADCADAGQTCGWQDDAIGNNCLSAAGGPCGDIDYAGACEGDRLVWCEGGALQEVDCADTSRSCGWQNDSIGNNCLGGGGGGGGGRLTLTEIVGGAYFEISQDYGPTDFDGGYSYCHSYGNFPGLTHCGLDVAIPWGTPLYAPDDATVITAGGTPYFQDADNYAAGELKFELPDGTQIIFGHMAEIDLGVGQWVGAGDRAGISGSQNGPHLHLEVRVPDATYGLATVDPVAYFGL